MAHLFQSCSYVSSSKSLCYVSSKETTRSIKRNNTHHSFQKNGTKIYPVRCSFVEQPTTTTVVDGGERKGENSNLVNEYGWEVRRLVVDNEDEIRRVSLIQTEAFHIPMPFFDDYFFHFFMAEVLSGLLYKLKSSPPNRYACLVAQKASDLEDIIVGVVDATVMRDKQILQHLPSDADEYIYVSGLAVSKPLRRKKMASALLKGIDQLSVEWGYKYLTLRAYEDDIGARTLYSNAGYRVVSADPSWFTTWIGRKRRVLMVKQSGFQRG